VPQSDVWLKDFLDRPIMQRFKKDALASLGSVPNIEIAREDKRMPNALRYGPGDCGGYVCDSFGHKEDGIVLRKVLNF
jgi:hypothetical protein